MKTSKSDSVSAVHSAYTRVALVMLASTFAGCGGSSGGGSSGGGQSPAPANQAPTVSAGADFSVGRTHTVALAGSAQDIDGSIATSVWSQTSGAAVALTGASTMAPTFTAPDATSEQILEFTLTVTDNRGATASDAVRVSVNPPWRSSMPMPRARWSTAACEANEKVYLFTAGDLGTDLSEFDPRLQTWTAKTGLVPGRGDGFACVTLNGKVYLLGGLRNGVHASSDVLAFNPATSAWTVAASMPTARYDLGVAVMNGRIYAIGGRGGSVNIMDVVEEYNPDTNTWTARARLPKSHHSQSVEAVNGKLYAMGGYHFDVSPYSYEYDPSLDSWRELAPMPTARWAQSSAVVGGKIYVFGGQSSLVPNAATTTAVVEEYSPAANSWRAKSSLFSQRMDQASATVGAAVYVLGGRTATQYESSVDLVEIYTPAWD